MFAILTAWALLFGPRCTGNGAVIGLPAPPLQLERLGGGNVNLTDLKGKVVLINFWATWCGPCVEEVPELEKLHRELEGKPFVMLAVSVDDTKKTVEQFARERNLTFPILFDKHGNLARTWGTVQYPETYIIDKKGNVAKKKIGMIDYKETVNWIEALMR